VLCFHSLNDLAGSPVIEEYGVPAAQFRRQLRVLRRAGFRFVTPEEVLRSVERRGGLPRRPLLVTFDDCYVDLLAAGAPILRDEQVPAVAFAVAGLVGGGNDWDTALGAPPLRLLDADGLRALERSGIEIGVHGGTHRPLTALTDDELVEETSGAATALAALGLSPPRIFAYPHGEHDERVRRRVAAAAFRAAFTVEPGLVRSGAPDRYALHRVEVLRRDGDGVRLLAKVALAGRLRPLRLAARSPHSAHTRWRTLAFNRPTRHPSRAIHSAKLRRLRRAGTSLSGVSTQLAAACGRGGRPRPKWR
jgi:peptidoglycan/xylan/chitin deacetylase (PgdA/CDA1 family)